MEQNNATTGTVVRSGFWYTVSNFLVRGIGFITLPVFARLMTKTEMSQYSNFLVWLSSLEIIFGFNLEASVNRARLDFPEDLDRYVSTIVLLGLALAAAGWGIMQLLYPYLAGVMQMSQFCLAWIFLYILFKKESTEGVSVNQVTAIDYDAESVRSYDPPEQSNLPDYWAN